MVRVEDSGEPLPEATTLCIVRLKNRGGRFERERLLYLAIRDGKAKRSFELPDQGFAGAERERRKSLPARQYVQLFPKDSAPIQHKLRLAVLCTEM